MKTLKRFFLISFVLVLSLSSASYGENGSVVIGDWEGGSLDNWQINWGSPSLSCSTTCATLNSCGLRVESDAGSWSWGMYLPLQDPDVNLMDWFMDNCCYDKFEMDVTLLASDWIPDGSPDPFTQLHVVLNVGGWSATGHESNFWCAAGVCPVGWDPSQGDQTYHCVWDLYQCKAEAKAIFETGYIYDRYLEIYIIPLNSGYLSSVAYCIDNARLVNIRIAADPSPADGASGVNPDIVLSWSPGMFADKHDVYFGTDEAAVTDANRTNPLGVLVSQNQDLNYYPLAGTLDLDCGTTYYWRIDDVNATIPPYICKGNIWSFTTKGCPCECLQVRVSQESSPGANDFDEHVLGCIDVFETNRTAEDYYAYDVSYLDSFSNQAFIGQYGIEPDRSHLFLVCGSDGLSLFVVHDKPEGAGSPYDPDGGFADMRFELLGDLAVRTVEDDPCDLYSYSGPASTFTSNHGWATCCTDGQVITGLDGDWTMLVEFTEYGGLNPGEVGLDSWCVYSADGRVIPLVLEQNRQIRLDCCDPKWSQPPVLFQEPNTYLGWDEESHELLPRMVADDFRCDSDEPVKAIRWWGSFVGWDEDSPPEPNKLPTAFYITIWDDVPAGMDANYSHPGNVVWDYYCDSYYFDFYGWEYDPNNPGSRLAKFEFYQGFDPSDYWYQPGDDEIYWLGIMALYDICNADLDKNGSVDFDDMVEFWKCACVNPPLPSECRAADLNGDGVIDEKDMEILCCQKCAGWPDPNCCDANDLLWPEYPWGWETRPHFFQDDAVRINADPRDWLYSPSLIEPIVFDCNSWDLSFELLSIAKPEQGPDLGDAPDSTNNAGKSMMAYPGIDANYPTVYKIGSPPFGPKHRNINAVAVLGHHATAEQEADIGWDFDGLNNIDPDMNNPNRDGGDDGVIGMPLNLPHCCQRTWLGYQKPVSSTFDFYVNVLSPNPSGKLYVNVWFDWNRDGDWYDVCDVNCGQAMPPTRIRVEEWAVQDQELNLGKGLHRRTTKAFWAYHPPEGPNEIWMRITLSGLPWGWNSGLMPAPWAQSGGAGPIDGYSIGETEDYYFVPDKTYNYIPIDWRVDLNDDNLVNFKDLAIFADYWLTSPNDVNFP